MRISDWSSDVCSSDLKLPVDYAINKTYSIAVLEFCLPDSPQNNYLHSASIVYRGSDKLFSNKQHYKIIELHRFKKISTELESDLDKWVFLLKHMRSIQHIPTILSHGVYKEALYIAEISNRSEEHYKMKRSS